MADDARLAHAGGVQSRRCLPYTCRLIPSPSRSPSVPDLQHCLQIACQAADAADRIAMDYFGGSIQVETKSDDSPVTVADREAEQAIRETLSRHFPDHGIHGEEFGRAGTGETVWLIDPIDGTRSFIRGLPFWSVQIALMHEGHIVAGVSSAPALGERATAIAGQGARLGDQALSVAATDTIEAADVSFGNLQTLAADAPRWGRLATLVGRAARTRAYGDYWHYHQLARGGLDAVIESDVNILDIAALSLVVTEAGGVFTDLEGKPVGLETTSVLAAATPALHQALSGLLHGD